MTTAREPEPGVFTGRHRKRTMLPQKEPDPRAANERESHLEFPRPLDINK